MSILINSICRFIHQTIAAQRRRNVGYIEQRMNVGLRYSRAQAQELIRSMLASYSKWADSEIQPRLAVSLPRENPWPTWEVVKDAALGPLGSFLTGIDFCNAEEGYPPREQRELFDAVQDFNHRHPDRALAILYHVGESFNDKSLESSVRWVHEAADFGAHRLGHAISLGVDPALYGNHTRNESVAERIDQLNYDLNHRDGLAKFGIQVDIAAIKQELQRLKACPTDCLLTIEYEDAKLDEIRLRQKYAIDCVHALGAVIEVCPTSNRRIGGITSPEHHPLKQFIASDAPFVIATDDPGIFGTTLADELAWVTQHHDVTDDAMAHIIDLAWSSRSEVLTGRLSQE